MEAVNIGDRVRWAGRKDCLATVTTILAEVDLDGPTNLYVNLRFDDDSNELIVRIEDVTLE